MEGVTDHSQGGGQRGKRGAGEVQHRGADDGAVHYSYTSAEQGLHGQYQEQECQSCVMVIVIVPMNLTRWEFSILFLVVSHYVCASLPKKLRGINNIDKRTIQINIIFLRKLRPFHFCTCNQIQ